VAHVVAVVGAVVRGHVGDQHPPPGSHDPAQRRDGLVGSDDVVQDQKDHGGVELTVGDRRSLESSFAHLDRVVVTQPIARRAEHLA